MQEMNELYEVLKIINGDNNENEAISPIPIISFEGLPGAGKTTQIKLVSEELFNKYGKSSYIDLPTQSPIGRIIQTVYKDSDNWEENRTLAPWFNPVMVSVDLRLAIKDAVKNGAKYAIMSRGLLSTYYYNHDAYKETGEELWDIMTKQLKGFYKPKVIIFLEIPVETAHERVVSRNRGKLRQMDYKEQMLKDREFLEDYLSKMPDIPIHTVNGLGTKEEVTQRIIEALKGYL